MIGRNCTVIPCCRASSAIAFTAGEDKVRWHLPTMSEVNDGSQNTHMMPRDCAWRVPWM